MTRSTHPIHQATNLPEGFDALAEECQSAAMRAVVDVLKEQGYNPTGDFMPGEVDYLDSVFQAITAAFLLNSREHLEQYPEPDEETQSIAAPAAADDNPPDDLDPAGVRRWLANRVDLAARIDGKVFEVVVDAMEPDALPRDEGVDVWTHDSGAAVTLTAPTRGALADFLLAHWGGGDDGWIANTVERFAVAVDVNPYREQMPKRRAAAYKALEAYRAESGYTGEMLTDIYDLVANLLHLADTCSPGMDDPAEHVLEMARKHYSAEVAESVTGNPV